MGHGQQVWVSGIQQELGKWVIGHRSGGTGSSGRHGEWVGIGSAASGRGWAWGMGMGSRPGGTGGIGVRAADTGGGDGANGAGGAGSCTQGKEMWAKGKGSSGTTWPAGSISGAQGRSRAWRALAVSITVAAGIRVLGGEAEDTGGSGHGAGRVIEAWTTSYCG